MPIVVMETGEIRENHLGLINNVLDEFGEAPVTTLTDPEQHVRNLIWYAKTTTDDIYKMKGPWAQETGWFAPVEAQAKYDVPDDFRYLVSGLFYTGRKADERSIEEIYAIDPGRVYSGEPSLFAIWEDQFVLLEEASEEFAENKSVVGDDANVYTCIEPHTAVAATNKPITGSDWASFWVRNTMLTSASTWVEGTDYVDGRITFLYRRGPTHMAATGDYPDLPDYAIECLKAGMKYKFAKYRERDDWEDFYGEYRVLYKQLRGEHPSGNNRGFAYMRRGNRT